MTALDTRSPTFTIALRGYDRGQVDEYIDHLQRLVQAAELRARDAETEFIFDEHAAIGPRVAEIFALAEAEARDLRDSAATKAEQTLNAARADAQALVEAAEKSAATVTERAERDHVVMFAELEQERERIRGEVSVLERRKAEAIGELHHLRELLGEAAGMATRVVEPDGRVEHSTRAMGAGDETVELPAVSAEVDDT